MRSSRVLSLMALVPLCSSLLTGVTYGPATAARAAAPTAGTDPVDGVAMIYPSKAGGQTWHLSPGPSRDPRLDGTALKPNPDGTFKVRDVKTRIGVSTTTYDEGTQENALVWSQPALRSRGYMHDPNDWRDVEITGYVRYLSGDDGDAFTWYARGGRHTGTGGPPQACWGTAYKGNLRYRDGAVRFEKELYHDGGAGYAQDPYQNGGASLKGRMTGFKVVMYNIPGGVRMEAYLDRGGDGRWTRVSTRDDTGTWPIDTANRCGGGNSETITWGGPKAAFRWDAATDVDVARLSVREIDPSGGSCGTMLSPAGVSATTYEPVNPPANAVDGNLATRWSGQGFGASLILDLGSLRRLCGTKVAWHRGEVRWNDYTVYVSSDGTTYTKTWEGRSSGTTAAPETRLFTNGPRDARYVKISFWQNPENDWASITEAAVLGPT